jgi:hypothetical protein
VNNYRITSETLFEICMQSRCRSAIDQSTVVVHCSVLVLYFPFDIFFRKKNCFSSFNSHLLTIVVIVSMGEEPKNLTQHK